jgi:fluoroacetyl-CoA thioesterase
MVKIDTGLVNETVRSVETRHLASAWGSGLAAVLATPALVGFCEECARLAVEPLLPQGQQTVGTEICLRHLAATPPGMNVRIRAELTLAQGRRLSFRVQAWDEIELIAEAEHERFVIDVERFEKRVMDKSSTTQDDAK